MKRSRQATDWDRMVWLLVALIVLAVATIVMTVAW
jgi:hypothetical protein